MLVASSKSALTSWKSLYSKISPNSSVATSSSFTIVKGSPLKYPVLISTANPGKLLTILLFGLLGSCNVRPLIGCSPK